MRYLRKSWAWASIGAFIVFLVSSCATRPAVPEGAYIPFVLERDLVGKTVGKGSFKAINGQSRTFTAYLEGIWEGATLTLTEDFEYDDGEKDRKTWRLTKLANGEFSGTREDVVGTARGFYDGSAFRLEYFIRLPDENGKPGMKLKFRDVLVTRADGRVINEATVGAFGFRVAQVSLEISPLKDPKTDGS